MESSLAPFSTQVDEAPCPPGYYCKGGKRYECGEGKALPARWYCPSSKMDEPMAMDPAYYGGGGTTTTLTVATPCEAGFFCSAGERKECGGAGLYCPVKSASPTPVDSGFYSMGGTSANARTGQTECEIGNYCRGGEKFECPAGKFGESRGMANADCSGLCQRGHYCEEGSTSATQRECGDPTGLSAGLQPTAVFCPLGSESYTTVRTGYHSVGNTPSTAYAELACDPGYYCEQGVRKECGSKAVYCQASVSVPTNVPPGYFSIGGTPQTRQDIELCPVGHFCIEGAKTLCPAGFYGDTQGVYQGNCTEGEKQCEAGYRCEGGVRRDCTGTGDGDASGDLAKFYCPAETSARREVQSGYYSGPPGAFDSANTYGRAYEETQCEEGTYCVAGQQQGCPPGTYGSSKGQTSSACSGQCNPGRYGNRAGLTTAQCVDECSPGYYCPAGSTKASQNECGGSHLNCPRGSAVPKEVRQNFAALPLGCNETCTGEQAAAAGSFAVRGVLFSCPAPGNGTEFKIEKLSLAGTSLKVTWPAGSGVVQKVIWRPDDGRNGETEVITGVIQAKANTVYRLSYGVLRSDLGNYGEYVDWIKVNGVELPGCDPRGSDYACDFVHCSGSEKDLLSATGKFDIEMSYTGHSKDCDCDTKSWECKSEKVPGNAALGMIRTKAAMKFTLAPANFEAVTATGDIRAKRTVEFHDPDNDGLDQRTVDVKVIVPAHAGIAEYNATCSLPVRVQNVNQPPELNDQTLEVDENGKRSTIIGVLEATDPDAGTRFTYTITGVVPPSMADAVEVKDVDGKGLKASVLVVRQDLLDYEALVTYRSRIILNVSVSDLHDKEPLTTHAAITVQLRDVNDLILAPKTAKSGQAGRPASSDNPAVTTAAGPVAYGAPDIDGLGATAVDMDAAGGTTVDVIGSNFGPAGTEAEAMYESLTAENTDSSVPQSQFALVSSSTTGSSSGASRLERVLGGAGSDLVVGLPSGAWTDQKCRVTVESVSSSRLVLRCVSAPGWGGPLRWRVRVGGQFSMWTPFYGSPSTSSNSSSTPKQWSSYAPPKVLSVWPRTGETTGDTLVTIKGQNFAVNRRVFFGKYEATVQYSNFTAIQVLAGEGVGVNLRVEVRVGTQSNLEKKCDGLCIPIVFFVIVQCNKQVVKGDQVLRLLGVGSCREDNPKFYEFRKRYYKIYYRFKPRYYYYASVILMRKAVIVMITVFMYHNATLQAASALMLMFLSFSIHLRSKPYLRHDLLGAQPDVLHIAFNAQ
eukprot:g3749.t1